MSEWLQEIGIKTEVTALNSAKLTDVINAGEYDLFRGAGTPTRTRVPSSPCSSVTSGRRTATTYGNNDAYYCNPEYDQLYQDQLGATDQDARWDIVHEAQKFFYEDSPYAVMWYDPIFSAWRSDRFDGLHPAAAAERRPARGLGRHQRGVALAPARGRARGAASTETKGISPAVWAILAGVLVLIVAIVLIRRRRPPTRTRRRSRRRERGRRQDRVGTRRYVLEQGRCRRSSPSSSCLVFNFFLFRVMPGRPRGAAAPRYGRVQPAERRAGHATTSAWTSRCRSSS